MFRSYYYLYRCSKELNALLKDKLILDAYTQEKDKLFLKIPLDLFPDHQIIFDCSPLMNYVTSKERHFKAKKNTISFFGGFIPDAIKNVKIALNDRALVFELISSSIYFIVQGAETNVVLVNPSGRASFKKETSAGLNIPSSFIENETELFSFLNMSENSIPEWKDFSKMFPFVGKQIFLQAKAGLKSGSIEEFNENICSSIKSVIYDDILVYSSPEEQRPVFLPAAFVDRNTSLPENCRSFNSYIEALNYYLSLKYKGTGEISLKNRIEKYIESELEKAASKLNSLKFRIDSGSKEDIYRDYGALLLSNMHLLQKGAATVELYDEKRGGKIEINIEAKLSPQKNVDRYFEKARDEKAAFEQSKELYSSALERKAKLDEILERINSGIPQEELQKLFSKLKITQQSKAKSMDDKCNYKHFILHGKYHVYVGKDSRNNDELTTQFAKQNDLWFHARGVSGSHVLLRIENSKEPVPKNIIKETAALAAYYSKAKTSGMAPVAYTFKKYVHKKKGLEPGQVILAREDVVIVKPEIPKECEPVIAEII